MSNLQKSKQKNDLKNCLQKDTIPTDSVLCLIPHKPPKNYSYESRKHNRLFISIWLHCHRRFVYNGGASTYTIWGFYNTKTKQFHAPINSKTIGDVVEINDTSPYTSMPLNLNPLMQCLMTPV